MQKLIALAAAGIWLLTLTVCESKSGVSPYIQAAQKITQEYTQDVCIVAQMDAQEKEILESGAAYLASILNLNEDELLDGIAAALLDAGVPTEHIPPFLENHGVCYFSLFKTDVSFACVHVVIQAYNANGKIDEVFMTLE